MCTKSKSQKGDQWRLRRGVEGVWQKDMCDMRMERRPEGLRIQGKSRGWARTQCRRMC